MKTKFIRALLSPYCLWIKDNKIVFFDNIKNGILLYVLFCLISMSGYFHEAIGLFDFVFNKMILIIFLTTFTMSILFYIYSLLYSGFLLDKIFIFLCKQYNSLMFFSLSALIIAIGFYLSGFLLSICEDGGRLELSILVFVFILFIVGSYLYKASLCFLIRGNSPCNIKPSKDYGLKSDVLLWQRRQARLFQKGIVPPPFPLPEKTT